MKSEPKSVAICGAMQWEIRPLFHCLRNVQGRKLGRFRFWLGQADELDVVVFRTGIGVDRADAATRTLIAHWTPDLIINTGCAGGLAENLKSGALVIANALLSEDDGILRTYETSRSWNERFAAAASAAGLPVCAGSVLTSRLPLTTSAAKHDAHARLGAIAVEMEGAVVAHVARVRGVPFASVRAILDPVGSSLPERFGARSPAPKSPGGLRSSVNLTKMRHLFGLANDLISANRALRAFFPALLCRV